MAAGQQDSPPGAPVYADYIAEQVVREDARKESVERRGLAVVTTSGALATLLFALAALSTKANDFHLSGWSEFFLALAVVALSWQPGSLSQRTSLSITRRSSRTNCSTPCGRSGATRKFRPSA